MEFLKCDLSLSKNLKKALLFSKKITLKDIIISNIGSTYHLNRV